MIRERAAFRAAAVQRSLPYRERGDLPLTGASFGPDGDGFCLYVTPDCVAELREGTRRSAPSEAFALLLGRSFEDGDGAYTVVTHAVYARQVQASGGHVRLSAAEMAALRALAAQTYPAEENVGWSHSHGVASDYSRVDREEQQTWPGPYYVGVLTFMEVPEGAAWARAYRGKQATPLPATALLPARTAAVPAHQPLFSRATRAGSRPEAADLPALEPRGRAALGMLWAGAGMILVAALALAGRQLDGRLATIGSLLTARERPAEPTVPKDVSWGCRMLSTALQPQVVCSAQAGTGITGWLWDFGDGAGASARTAAHTYGKPGAYRITLTLLTPAGSLDLGSQNLSTAPVPQNLGEN